MGTILDELAVTDAPASTPAELGALRRRVQTLKVAEAARKKLVSSLAKDQPA